LALPWLIRHGVAASNADESRALAALAERKT
jgi:hypothetical protein